MRFESKRDGWIVLVVRAVPFAVLAVIAAVESVRGHNMRGVIVGLITVLFFEIVLIEPMMRWTYYRIERDTLVIRSGIGHWRINIFGIRSITATRNFVSAPALSMDRLRISYDDKSILVSPQEPQRFIEALRAIHPAIVA